MTSPLGKQIVRVSVFLAVVAPSLLFGQQPARLTNLWVREGIHGHRVVVELDGQVRYGHLFVRQPPRVIVYLRDVRLDVPQPVLTDPTSPVFRIAAVQWMESPPVVKLTIDLQRPALFEVVQEGRFLYIDLRTSELLTGPAVRRTASPVPAGSQVQQQAISGGFASLDPVTAVPASSQEGSAQIQDPGPLITLEVHEADIGNVLRLLSRQSKLNIIASQEVTGPITVSLHKVTLKEALENILKANGYTYIVDGDVILVKPAEKLGLSERETRVYRLRYIDAYNLKNAIQDATSDHAKITVFSRKFLADQEAKAQGGAASTQQRRSSTLIVTDLPENIAQIDAIVEELDKPVPMVMIEAKLIELSPKHEGQLGINWTKTLDASLFSVDQTTGRPYSVHNPDVFRGGPWSFGTLTASQFGAVLDFLRRETHSKLVSNPRILAMDNEESMISVGTTFPIPQINRGVAGQGDIVTFQDRSVDISLRVTPHVNPDNGTITMYVNPIIEEVTGEVVVEQNRAPITSKRTVESVVTVRDGETLVIGGLIKEGEKTITEKVWFLGDIPLIGNFFRHRNKEKVQTDLLIFITPRVVEGTL